MGTRGLIAVMKNSEYKVAQYNQWDSDPSGNGIKILKFLKTHSINKFSEQLEKLYWLSEDEIYAVDNTPNWTALYPHLSRDCGTDILKIIQDNKDRLGLISQIDFAMDSIFCEWAYVIDLDKMTFEVFKGFNRDTLTPMDRFAPNGPYKKIDLYGGSTMEETAYKPVKLVKWYPLAQLPTQKQFLDDCVPKEHE